MNIQNVTIVGFNPPTFGPKNKQNNAASTTTVPVAQIFCSQGYHTHKPKKERKTLRKFRLGAQIRMTNVASQVPKEVPQSLFLNYYQEEENLSGHSEYQASSEDSYPWPSKESTDGSYYI
jgi:hypothetical protein